MPIIKNGWLILEERDIVDVTFSMASITEVFKHWDDTRRRSFLCNGRDDCPYCVAGNAKRQRWRATVFLDGQSLQFEFGADIHIPLFNLPGHAGDFLNVRLSRRGIGRMAKYDVSRPPKTNAEIKEINDRMAERRQEWLALHPPVVKESII